MKTRAAVLRKGGEPWELTDLDLDEPKAGEVLIRFEAACAIPTSTSAPPAWPGCPWSAGTRAPA